MLIGRAVLRPRPARALLVKPAAEQNAADTPEVGPLYFYNGKPTPKNPITPEHDLDGAYFQGTRYYAIEKRLEIFNSGTQRERYDLAGAFEIGVGLDGTRNAVVAREIYARLDDEGYVPATLNLADMYATELETPSQNLVRIMLPYFYHTHPSLCGTGCRNST